MKAAIDRGDLSEDRVTRWRKLKREDARNSESIAEAHARDRAFGRMVKQVKAEKKR